MAKYALVIGIENFEAVHNLENVGYAKQDAQGMADLLERAKFDSVVTLINEEANFVSVNTQLESLLSLLENDDEFWVYYAGHGRVDGRGRTVLACQDSPFTHEIEEGLPLGKVLAPFAIGNGARAVVFVDACNSAPTPELPLVFNQTELMDVTRSASRLLCFTACQANESARWSDEHQHGIFTHHVLKAMGGLVPQTLNKGRFLDPYLLYGYLRNTVPEEVASSLGGSQNPSLYGSFSGQNHLLDVAAFFEPKIIDTYVIWRLCAWTRDHSSEAQAFQFVKKQCDGLIEKLQINLQPIIMWDKDNGVDRGLRWTVNGATLNIDASWRYRGSSGFVAADIILTTDNAALYYNILDLELAAHFCLRIQYADEANFDILPPDIVARLGSRRNAHQQLRVSLNKSSNSRELEIAAEHIDPDNPGFFRAHHELPFCVINSIHKGCLTPLELSQIAEKCF